jgi:hypothetical protein
MADQVWEGSPEPFQTEVNSLPLLAPRLALVGNLPDLRPGPRNYLAGSCDLTSLFCVGILGEGMQSAKPDPFLCVRHQTQASVEQTDDARVHDLVENIIPVAPRSDHAFVNQSLKLVGYCLGFHAERFGKVRYTQLPGPRQGVKHPQASLVGQDLKKRLQFDRFLDRKQRPRSYVWFFGTAVLWHFTRHVVTCSTWIALLHNTV